MDHEREPMIDNLNTNEMPMAIDGCLRSPETLLITPDPQIAKRLMGGFCLNFGHCYDTPKGWCDAFADGLTC